jgi:hypothetical protein
MTKELLVTIELSKGQVTGDLIKEMVKDILGLDSTSSVEAIRVHSFVINEGKAYFWISCNANYSVAAPAK